MTDPTKVERLWVALAPAGVPSPGPAVCPSEDIADEYRRMGWEVRGPYLPVQEVERLYPYEEGDVTVLGPEIFAARDRSVICWQGENYIPAQEVEQLEQALRELVEALSGVTLVGHESVEGPARAALSQAREILGGSE